MRTVESGGPVEIYELAPGVRGYAIESAGSIYIPAIEGNGDGSVGRFLDHLPPNAKVSNVVSGRLGGMLKRRGFVNVPEYVPEFGDEVDVWVRREVAR